MMRSRPARALRRARPTAAPSAPAPRASPRARRIGAARLGSRPSARQQLLIERAPIGADAHRLAILQRHLDDGGELRVLLSLKPTLPGLMRYLSSACAQAGGRPAACGRCSENRRSAARRRPTAQPLADMRDGGRRFVAIDGDAHEFGAGARERRDLARGTSTSAVSVLVIDCTTIGAPPPTVTPPTSPRRFMTRRCLHQTDTDPSLNGATVPRAMGLIVASSGS